MMNKVFLKLEICQNLQLVLLQLWRLCVVGQGKKLGFFLVYPEFSESCGYT